MNKTFAIVLLSGLFAGNLVAQNKTTPKVSGLKIYEDNCLTCHQGDGSGVPGMAPTLSQTEWVLGDKKRLINIVLKGLKEPLEINGETFHNPMPAHSHLKDDEIAAVLTYIRSNFGNKTTAISTAEVKKLRTGK